MKLVDYKNRELTLGQRVRIEENIHTNKVCLSIDFQDGNHDNFKIDNLRLLCPNCYLSFNGRFPSSKTFCK